MKLHWVDHPKISLRISLTFDIDKVTMKAQIVSYTISPILISIPKREMMKNINHSIEDIVDPVLTDFLLAI